MVFHLHSELIELRELLLIFVCKFLKSYLSYLMIKFYLNFFKHFKKILIPVMWPFSASWKMKNNSENT